VIGFFLQAEVIASTWVERKKAGGIYGRRQARGNKHVVVCCRHFSAETTMDFLTEFYAHPKLDVILHFCITQFMIM